MRRRFVKDLPQPNLRQTSNGIVILRERLSGFGKKFRIAGAAAAPGSAGWQR